VRKHAWQGREVPLSGETWALIVDDRRETPERDAETAELLAELERAIERELTPHQREVLVAVALNDVPIDVLAERLNTTRGAPLQDRARRSAETQIRARRPRPAHRRTTELDVSPSSPTDRDPLLSRLLGPAGPELSCDECFDQLDRYVELELAGSDGDAAIAGMREHLEGCSACAEDRDSLRELVVGDAAAGD
jgi:hypothetical protein